MSQDSEIYEVEEIRKKRICSDGSILYLIKWKDFPGNLKSNLKNLLRLIAFSFFVVGVIRG